MSHDDDPAATGLSLSRRSFLAAGGQLLVLAAAPAPGRAGAHSWLGLDPPAEASRLVTRRHLPVGARARLGDLRLVHPGGVGQLLFSPDGAALVSTGGDRQVRFWNPGTGVEHRAFALEGARGAFLAFGPDGDSLLAAGTDGARVLGPEGQDLPGPRAERWVSALAVHPGRGLVALGRPDLASSPNRGDLYLVRYQDGAEVWHRAAHDQPVGGLAFHPDGSLLASISHDKQVRLWETRTGALRWERALEKAADDLAFDPTGQRLVVAAEALHFLDVARGEELERVAYERRGQARVALSRDGRWLAAASEHPELELLDLGAVRTAGEPPPRRRLRAAREAVVRLAFSPDSRRLAAGGRDGRIRLFDVARGEELLHREGMEGAVLQVAVAPDGTRFASVSEDRAVRTWDAATLAPEHTLEGHREAVLGLVFTPESRRLLSYDRRGLLRAWDPASGAAAALLPAHRNGTRGFTLAGDGTRAAASRGGSRFVVHLDVMNGGPSFEVDFQQRVGNLAFSPTEDRLAVLACRDEVWIYDLAARGFLRVCMVGHEHPPSFEAMPLLYTPDGRSLIVGSAGGVVTFLDPSRGIAPGAPLTRGVIYVDFSKQGAAQSWDPRRGPQPEQHQLVEEVGALALSPDARVLAVADGRRPRILLLRLADREVLHEFEGHDGGVTALAFSPDGRTLLSGGKDGTLLLWDPKARR